jgi:alpha-L-fucosidase 2
MTWTQALPVGNGIIGGMVFGIPASEHIQLNEETIWAGQPNQVLNPAAKENLPKVRQLIFEGKYREAQRLAD